MTGPNHCDSGCDPGCDLGCPCHSAKADVIATDYIDDAAVRELERILAGPGLTPLFAPIAELHQRDPHGYQGQIQGPPESPLRMPLTLFGVAEHSGRAAELKLAALARLACSFCEQELPGKLFYPVNPAALQDPAFSEARVLAALDQAHMAPERLVLELSEHHSGPTFRAMREAVAKLRGHGIQIALRGFGGSHGRLLAFPELRPHYVKLHRLQTSGLQGDLVRQDFVRATLDVARRFNCLTVAEGIGCEEDLRAAESLGLPLLQGEQIGKAETEPRRRLPKKLFPRIRKAAQEREATSSETIAGLVMEIPPVIPSFSVEEVGEVFRSAPQLQTIPVVDDGKPIGLVRRMNFMNLFLSRYGRDLHGKKPISLFMDTKPVVVEHDEPVDVVSRKLTEQTQFSPQQDFVITRNGRYLGVGHMVDLLRKITELQILHARYANPLSGLPGNVPINDRISGLLQAGRSFVVVYVDLDNFKPFNDVYGYAKGDEVIVAVADLLLQECDPNRDFVGHVGGDDFVMIFERDDWQECCERILAGFEQRAPLFYTKTDRDNGGLWGEDRRGQKLFFHFLSLSLGAVRADPTCCTSHHDVAAMATEAKHLAKKQEGNHLFIDRRRERQRVA